MKLLEGKVAVVTGGTRGIGLAIAEHGAQVVAGARHAFGNLPEGVEYHELDVSSVESSRSFTEYVLEKYGRIDVLVNDAGIMSDRTTRKMTDDEFDSVIATNLKGSFNMVRLIGPMMQKNGYGSIVSISSFIARQGNFGQANYAASKAGIEAMTRCWAREFSSKGENVRVNALAPGVVKTDIYKNTPREVVDGFATKTMLKRLATPEEVANAALFLASDMSSYVTGTVLAVDGGIII